MNDANINKIIETTIENKFNDLVSSLSLNANANANANTNANANANKDFTNFTIIDIYKNTIQTIIDIINETMVIIDNSSSNYFTNIIMVFFKEYRMFYIGIILIILSFVIYFIDD
jgi:hypothetical protein